MNKNFKTIKELMKYLFVLGVFAFALQAFAVWSPKPTALPNNNNTSAPINTGNSLQLKQGVVAVHGFRSIGPAVFDSTIQIPTGGEIGKVLTSDASGNASWGTPSGGGGDTWTRDIANTTTKLTNINDKVGIGIALPNNKLQVAGLINFDDALSSTAVGKNALLSNTGGFNTAFGYNALTVNSTGTSNTAIGKDALKANTTVGRENTAVGVEALVANTVGLRNTAIGHRASYNTTVITDLILLGNVAGGQYYISLPHFRIGNFGNTSHLIAAGSGSNFGASPSRNMAIGANALADMSISAAFGYGAVNNTAQSMVFGNSAVTGWGFGTQPEFLGGSGPEQRPVNSFYAGAVTNGNYCHNMGYRFTPNTNGTINKLWYKGAGSFATLRLYLNSNPTPLVTTGITPGGVNTWVSVDITPINVTAGVSYVVAVSTSSPCAGGYSNTVSLPAIVGNITINTSVYNASGSGFPSVENSTRFYGIPDISFSPTVAPSSVAIKVGTTISNGNGASLTKAGVWTSPSDRTKKHEIKNISVGLKEILSLRPVDFKWNGSNKEDLGFIAQEVKPILPKLVSGEEGDMAISYSQMTAVLNRAIQEQQEMLEQDKNNLEEFEKTLNNFEIKNE